MGIMEPPNFCCLEKEDSIRIKTKYPKIVQECRLHFSHFKEYNEKYEKFKT